MLLNQFNVRVYGILMDENRQLLLLKEPFQGKMIYKFPGGGLEFGEGPLDCLKREFQEELNLNISETKHFYTQDFYQRSGIRPNEQLLMLYYCVQVQNIQSLKILDRNIETAQFYPLNEHLIQLLTLETDRLVCQKLIENLD